jgi:xanthine dehydrogenase YagR molybdenum-binding subunit
MADETRKQSILVGLAGETMERVERTVPADEPPPLETNDKLHSIGKPVPRLDGKLKVTGSARYTADVKLPGMLYASMVTSPHPHARVRNVDTTAASAAPGVRAVHVLERILGSAEVRDKSKEVQSKYPVVRYAGQPVAAVAATTQAAADAAAELVRVEYETLPFVVDIEKARAADAPLVFPAAADQAETSGGGGGPAGIPQTGNVRGPMRAGKMREKPEEISAALAAADVRVEGEFRTQVQTHSALETHGAVADWKADGLTVYISTQATVGVRDELAEIFGLPKSKIRVVTEFMGGGFGAKFSVGNSGVVATHLSKKSGVPVKLMLNRKDEHLSVGNRPSSVQKLRIGASKEGKLQAIHLVSYGTAGVGTGAGVGGPAMAMYDCPKTLAEESDVFIHAGPGEAFRAPGHPQGCFALEQLIDELAEKLNIDPLVLRDLNDTHNARRAERKIGAERVGWSSRHKPGADRGVIKRGLGVAQSVWYRFTNHDSACEVRIDRDGSVEILSAVQDLGTGIRTALAQVVAEELGLAPQAITVRIGDTAFPVGPASGGSVTTSSITPPARNAAWKAKQQLFAQIAPKVGIAASDLDAAGGFVTSKSDPAKRFTFREAAAKMPGQQISARAERGADYGTTVAPGQSFSRGVEFYGGVQFAQVAVDTETGIIRVEKVTAVHDCGRPINPLGIESQINGGIIQGVSFALFENRLLDRNTGLMVNPNLEQYKIAGALDTPEIDIILVENLLGRTSTDAGGIGEPATIPTVAAIANAVYNAIGARIYEMPMTPARVLTALRRKGATA